MSTFDNDLKRRYCVLWIPTLRHGCVDPIIDEETAFIIKKEWVGEHVEKQVKEFPAYRIYQYDDEEFIDPNKDIQLTNVLASDNESGEVFLNLTLLEAGVVVKEGKRISLKNETESEKQKKLEPAPLRHVYIKTVSEEGEDTLFLECMDARRNGMFLYRYEYKETVGKNGKKRYLLNSENKIPNAVYHAVKSLYHVHQYHDSGKDSMFTPYSSDETVNLTTPNNPALLHYLEEFEGIFSDELELLKEMRTKYDNFYHMAKENLIKGKEKIGESRLSKIKKWFGKNILMAKQPENIIGGDIRKIVIDGYEQCLANCNRALSIHVYYQALFYSKYNKFFLLKPSESVTYELRKEWRSGRTEEKTISLTPKHEKECNRREGKENSSDTAYKSAINIHNIMEIFKQQRKEVASLISAENHKIMQTITEETSRLGSKLTIKTTGISILTGIVAGIAFFCLAQKDSADSSRKDHNLLHSTQAAIHSRLEEQNKQLEEQTKTIDHLTKTIEDLSKKTLEKQNTSPTHTPSTEGN